jgi:phytoene synthase
MSADLERMIAKGSKSFALAARLFDGPTRDGAIALYAWCRRCDDEIDGSELGLRAGDRPVEIGADEALRRLGILRARTEAAMDGRPDADPVFAAFSALVRTFGVPRAYPRELLEGMAMDVRRERYESFEGLLHYCYRVAGTVGLMMSHVMGLSDAAALRNAADLGMAMQLTNIARDVREDAEAGRVYLPLAWLREAGVPADDVMNPAHRDGLAAVVWRLLAEADRLYRSGDAGLGALPFRSACAVTAARRVYAEIGRSVEAAGGAAWDTRTVVSGPRKAALAAGAVAATLGTLPARRARPWRRAPLDRVWNPFSSEVHA